jgi:hypothetical protein
MAILAKKPPFPPKNGKNSKNLTFPPKKIYIYSQMPFLPNITLTFRPSNAGSVAYPVLELSFGINPPPPR